MQEEQLRDHKHIKKENRNIPDRLHIRNDMWQ